MERLIDLARQHGFNTIEKLRAASQSLTGHYGDQHRSYLAHSPNGYWFVWEIRLRGQEQGTSCASH